MKKAAIILCAGKGTRMNDDSRNKVCFDCAGVPVIRRIIDNMRAGGISLFVLVVGHLSQTVMDCLDGEPGILYTYQKEQKGTGHAALCGLKALRDIGYSGSAVISMGDKIIAPGVIVGLLEREESAVWGVQPVENNYYGGRVILRDGKPYGVVELADAVLMVLAGKKESEYRAEISKYRLNEKKAEKILQSVMVQKPEGSKVLSGTVFTAEEILKSRYANAGLYCLDVEKAIAALEECDSSNAQGEIYLTDALEWFSGRGCVAIYEVRSAEDMLTFSTKRELQRLALHYILNP